MDAGTRLLWRTSLIVFLSIAIVFVMIVWKNIFLPIVIAVAVWYVINATARGLRRVPLGTWRLPPAAALTLAVVLVCIACAGLVQLLIQSGQALAVAAPVFGERLDTLLTSLAQALDLNRTLTTADIFGGIDARAMAASVAGSLASVVFDAIMVFFYVLFLLIQQHYMPKKLSLIISNPERRRRWEGAIARIQHDIQRYISVMVILAIVTGLITYAVLSFVGVEYAALWATIIAFFSFLPTIGTVFGIAVPALVALLQFGEMTPFLIVLVILGVAQILLNNLAQPTMMGKSLNLSPFIVLVSLAVWSAIWGVTGAVLSIPITVAAMIIMAHVPSARPVAIVMSLDGEVD